MPQLEVQVAVAKVSKYATSESGDSVEMVERPQGGLSLVVTDGQRSGRTAKSISNIVVRKAMALLAEGVRDGAVARAAHDYLRTIRGGKVSATLNIVSIDLETETVVISRNSHCPTIVYRGGQVALLDEPSEPIGIRTWTKPVITELPIAVHTHVVVFTDGLMHAGRYDRRQLQVPELVEEVRSMCAQMPGSAQSLADAILAEAVERDRGRPRDDVTVVVVSVRPPAPGADGARRMFVRFPIRVAKATYEGG